MLKKILFAAALAASAAFPAAAGPTKLGVLSCAIDGGTGYVVASNKTLSCTFRSNGSEETYTGIVSKIGVDIGETREGNLQWAVLALGGDYDGGELAGKYYGVNAEATVVTGGGVNVLVGGFQESYALQPLSVQSQTGLNAALAVASLELVSSLK